MKSNSSRRWALALTLVAGTGLAAEVHFSGTAFLNQWLVPDPRVGRSVLSGLTPELAIKLDADVHELVTVSAKACFSCHGVEVAHGYVDFTPKPYFNLQAGRLVVPFGDFAQRYDPAAHRPSSKPLIYDMGRMGYFEASAFNLGIVPAPYVDTGLLVYGHAFPHERLQLWYGAYVVNGLKGGQDFDFASMRVPYYVDVNKAPAVGGRFVLTLSGAAESTFKDLTVGVSGMHGGYDPALLRTYTAVGVDAALRLGKVTARAEAAWIRRTIDPLGTYRFQVIDPFVDKAGAYLEVEHPIGERISMAYRVDALRRVGVTLLTQDERMAPDSYLLRGTVATQVALFETVFLKASYEYTYSNVLPSFHAGNLGLGATF